MKKRAFFSVFIVVLVICPKAMSQTEDVEHLNCVEYWARVSFNDFCGISTGNFDFNTIPVDICNADSNTTYRFDDRVTVRVYNHFSEEDALEEYNAEEADAISLVEYTPANHLGDDGFALITKKFGKLSLAIIQVVKGTFTIYLEIKGQYHTGSNNCFDEALAVEFARVLAEAL